MRTFLDYYRRKIQAHLAEIDIFLKTEQQPYSPERAAQALNISQGEIDRLMREEKLAVITKGNFLRLMQNASSPLCATLKRELHLAVPLFYSLKDIAYIYQLKEAAVEEAAKKLGMDRFPAGELPRLFENIPIADKQDSP